MYSHKTGSLMETEALQELVINTLEEMKARDIDIFDVREKTSITDLMIIACGTSDRHVKSIAESVAFQAKLAGESPLGVEGAKEGEWALIDLNSIVVHVMLPKVRDFYQIERLWKDTKGDHARVARTESAVTS